MPFLLIIALLLLTGCTTYRPDVSFNNPITTVGVSMEPSIRNGTKLTLSKVDYNSLEVGQVVTYQNVWFKNLSLTHRLVRKTPRGWVTKGDNNAYEDIGLVTPENLIGLVVRQES